MFLDAQRVKRCNILKTISLNCLNTRNVTYVYGPSVYRKCPVFSKKTARRQSVFSEKTISSFTVCRFPRNSTETVSRRHRVQTRLLNVYVWYVCRRIRLMFIKIFNASYGPVIILILYSPVFAYTYIHAEN